MRRNRFYKKFRLGMIDSSTILSLSRRGLLKEDEIISYITAKAELKAPPSQPPPVLLTQYSDTNFFYYSSPPEAEILLRDVEEMRIQINDYERKIRQLRDDNLFEDLRERIILLRPEGFLRSIIGISCGVLAIMCCIGEFSGLRPIMQMFLNEQNPLAITVLSLTGSIYILLICLAHWSMSAFKNFIGGKGSKNGVDIGKFFIGTSGLITFSLFLGSLRAYFVEGVQQLQGLGKGGDYSYGR